MFYCHFHLHITFFFIDLSSSDKDMLSFMYIASESYISYVVSRIRSLVWPEFMLGFEH